MAPVNLSVSAYGVNADVHARRFCDAMSVAKAPWKSDLQETFARRVREELGRRQMSGNALARLAESMNLELGQPSVSRILKGKQDPSLEIVAAIAQALGVPAWYLMTEASQVEERVIRTPAMQQKVVRLRSPYPSIGTERKKQDSEPSQRAVGKKKRT